MLAVAQSGDKFNGTICTCTVDDGDIIYLDRNFVTYLTFIILVLHHVYFYTKKVTWRDQWRNQAWARSLTNCER